MRQSAINRCQSVFVAPVRMHKIRLGARQYLAQATPLVAVEIKDAADATMCGTQRMPAHRYAVIFEPRVLDAARERIMRSFITAIGDSHHLMPTCQEGTDQGPHKWRARNARRKVSWWVFGQVRRYAHRCYRPQYSNLHESDPINASIQLWPSTSGWKRDINVCHASLDMRCQVSASSRVSISRSAAAFGSSRPQ